jgi:hypothetical protein
MKHFLLLQFVGLLIGGVRAQFIDVSSDVVFETNFFSGQFGQGVSVTDINGDFTDDVTFAHPEGNIRCYIGNGVGEFEELDLELEGAVGEDAKMVLWADVDNDGDQDLFVTFRLARNRMYLNDGNLNLSSFNSGLRDDEQKSYGAAFGDINGDGFLDLFVANYSDGTTMNPVNELYFNAGLDAETGEWMGFIDMGLLTGFDSHEGYQSFQGQFVDFDLDGDMELHVVKDRLIYENALYDITAGSISNVAPEYGLDVSINCMSTSVADFDCDLDDDVFLTGLTPPDSNRLMVNNGSGYFIEHPAQAMLEADGLQPAGRTCWAANWVDVDCDGWEDLHVVVGTTEFTHKIFDPEYVFQDDTIAQDALYWNHNGGLFVADSSDLFVVDEYYSYSTAVGDLNGDGFADLVSHRAGSSAQVLFATPNENRWLKFNLRGIQSNRNGIGARITVYTEGHAQTRMVYAGENYLGQNSLTQHFGMGNLVSYADSVVVQWPAGGTTVIEDVLLDSYYAITENGQIFTIQSGQLPQEGCTYPSACNFDVNATEDDSSCDFSCMLQSLCGAGTVWDEDSGSCICECSECLGDFDGDGYLSINDLLTFLVQFGLACDD